MKEKPILFSTSMVQAILEGRKTQTRRVIKPQPKAEYCKPGGEYPNSLIKCDEESENSIILLRSPKTAWACHIKDAPKIYNKKGCPYGQPEDLLWVKETFFAYGHWTQTIDTETGKSEWNFKDLTIDYEFTWKFVDNPPEKVYKKRGHLGWYKRPSIFMPKVAARIWLKIKDVHVERLQDISEIDSYKEGMKQDGLYVECPVCVHGSHNGVELICEDGIFYTARSAFQSLWHSINGVESWNANPWVWVVEYEVVSTTGKPAIF